MESIFRLKDTLVQAVKRRRTYGPGTPSDVKEHQYLAPATDVQDKAAYARAFSGVKPLPFALASNPRKRAYVEEPDLCLERDVEEPNNVFTVGHRGENVKTRIISKSDNAHEALSPDDSISQITPGEDDECSDATPVTDDAQDEGMDVEDDEDDEVEEDPADARVREYLRRQAELVVRLNGIEQAKATGTWHPDELFVFERISMRSYEPILPAHWKPDFPTLPDDIFTNEAEQAFISPNGPSRSSGVKQLQALIKHGQWVRDNLENRIAPERRVKTVIQQYIKWSERDGGFSRLRFIPVLSLVVGSRGERSASITKTITSQMNFLAQKHRENLAIHPDELVTPNCEPQYRRQPPLLYGIIVAQSIVLLCTLDSALPGSQIRHIANFDFKEKDVDVWNGIAIAIIIIMARNSVIAIKDELEPEEEESDPDA